MGRSEGQCLYVRFVDELLTSLLFGGHSNRGIFHC